MSRGCDYLDVLTRFAIAQHRQTCSTSRAPSGITGGRHRHIVRLRWDIPRSVAAGSCSGGLQRIGNTQCAL